MNDYSNLFDLRHRLSLSETLDELLGAPLQRERQEQGQRAYLGASIIGRECARAIQYSFLGTPQDPGREFTGQKLRIFHRGHEGEKWMTRWFRQAGFDLRTEKQNGEQFGFEACDGRFRGHGDGVFCAGPTIMLYPALWENKMLGAKGMAKLKKNGLKDAYQEYYAQVQTYMAYMGLEANPALFTALNADTMEIHAEQVPFDAPEAQRVSDRAVTVLRACDAGVQLPRIAQNADFFVCKWCDFAQRCWAA